MSIIRGPWVETRGYDIGHAYGILLGRDFTFFPWVETHDYDIGHAYGIFYIVP